MSFIFATFDSFEPRLYKNYLKHKALLGSIGQHPDISSETI